MPKLTKQEYIKKAAILYGLSDIEVDALEKHLSGEDPNEFIVRRCPFLFRLYDIYNSKEFNEHIDPDDDGLITLDDYAFEISKRRLADSKIGLYWIISSNLDAYLATIPANRSADIEKEYLHISEKNNFLIPQLAKQLGIDATIYYKAEYIEDTPITSLNSKERIEHVQEREDLGDLERYKRKYHLTKNFIKAEETLIRGLAIDKTNPERLMVDFDRLLEATDKFVRKHYKRFKLPQEETEKTRKEIRQGLIKQTLFNKMVFNENEGNDKWGLIMQKDHRLRLAPLFSYDFCANVKTFNKMQHRVVNKNKEYIEDFILHFSDEPWFKEWIDSTVVNMDLEKAAKSMEKSTGVTLTEAEMEYYNYAIMEKMHSRVVNASDLNYDETLVTQERKKNISVKQHLKTIRRRMHDAKISKNRSKDEEVDDLERLK